MSWSWRIWRLLTWSPTLPAGQTCSDPLIDNDSSHQTQFKKLTNSTNVLSVILYGLFKRSDVSEGAKEQHNDVPLIPDWGNVHQKPQRGPWDTMNAHQNDQIGNLGSNTCVLLLLCIFCFMLSANDFYQSEWLVNVSSYCSFYRVEFQIDPENNFLRLHQFFLL